MLVVRYGAGEWGVGELWFRGRGAGVARAADACAGVARTPGEGADRAPRRKR